MTAIRDLIIDEVATAFAAIASEVEVMPSGDPAAFDAIHLFDDGDIPEEQTEVHTQRQILQLAIQGFIETDLGGREALKLLNALYARTVQTLFATADPSELIEEITLGRMVIAVAPLASRRRLAFTLDVGLTYPTRRGDPEAQ